MDELLEKKKKELETTILNITFDDKENRVILLDWLSSALQSAYKKGVDDCVEVITNSGLYESENFLIAGRLVRELQQLQKLGDNNAK